MKRFVPALVASVILTGATGSTALAATDQPYFPVGKDGVEVSSTRVAPGQAVTVTFGGFKPYSVVTITVDLVSEARALSTSAGDIELMAAQSYTRTADGRGVVTLEIPLNEAGTYNVGASGIDPSGKPRNVSTEVVAALKSAGTGNGAGSSSEDGATAVLALAAGLTATAAGAGYAARRRRMGATG